MRNLTTINSSAYTQDYFVQVARGKVPGHSIVNTQATNTSVGTVFEDIWDAGGIMTLPTTAETWELVSDSTDDTLAGTGARTVFVESLDSDYNTQTQFVTMNGTTPVALTGTHYRPRVAIAWTAGSGRVNAGNITLRLAGGGATRGLMVAGNSTTFSSHYTVPANYSAFGVNFNAFAPKNDDAEIKAIINPFGMDRATISGGSFLLYQNEVSFDQEPPFLIAEKTDIKFQSRSSNPAVSVTTLFNLLLIHNSVGV